MLVSLLKLMSCGFSYIALHDYTFLPSGALPISPAVYGGSLAPVLFESPVCFGGLQDRLIDCSFTNVGSALVTSLSRPVGVRCESKCELTYPAKYV